MTNANYRLPEPCTLKERIAVNMLITSVLILTGVLTVASFVAA